MVKIKMGISKRYRKNNKIFIPVFLKRRNEEMVMVELTFDKKLNEGNQGQIQKKKPLGLWDND